MRWVEFDTAGAREYIDASETVARVGNIMIQRYKGNPDLYDLIVRKGNQYYIGERSFTDKNLAIEAAKKAK